MTSGKTIRIVAVAIAIISALAFGLLISLSRSEAAQGSPDRIWNEMDASRLVAPAGTQVLTPVKFCFDDEDSGRGNGIQKQMEPRR